MTPYDHYLATAGYPSAAEEQLWDEANDAAKYLDVGDAGEVIEAEADDIDPHTGKCRIIGYVKIPFEIWCDPAEANEAAEEAVWKRGERRVAEWPVRETRDAE